MSRLLGHATIPQTLVDAEVLRVDVARDARRAAGFIDAVARQDDDEPRGRRVA